MNKLFEKNLESWKQNQLAGIYNKELQLRYSYEKELVKLSNKKEEIKNAKFLPLSEGQYYSFN